MARKRSARARNAALEQGADPIDGGGDADRLAESDERAHVSPEGAPVPASVDAVTPAAIEESQPAPPAGHDPGRSEVTESPPAESRPADPPSLEAASGDGEADMAIIDTCSDGGPDGDLDAAGDERSPIVTIAAPLGEIPPASHLPAHVELRFHGNREGAEALKRLLAGLVERGEMLPATHRQPFGKPVASYADALRWLIGQLASPNTPSLPAAQTRQAA